MRFSDFLLVSDPADLDFIVGYADDQNIRIDVSDFFASNISGSGTPGYVPVFTSAQVIGDSVIFQHGSNIVIGGVNSLGYKLAVSGSLYASNGAVINSTISGADALRVIGGDGDIFVIPNDLGQPISSLRRINHPPAVLTTESATLGQLNSAISTLEGDIEILLDLKVDKTSVGVPNGVASLDAGGKVPLSQIPDSIIGQVQYMGTWNALTNTPTLNPLVPEEKGHYYVVSVAGVFGGVDYAVGDWIISNGLIWEKVDNTDAVTSVFGRIGAILALEADYQSFYPRLSQAYDNPTWINTLAFSKITGVPPFLLENQTITLSGDVTGSGKTSISTTISDNAVTDSKLRNSVGTSVIGRASSTTGDPADIQATTDGHVLLRSGGNLLFGLISSDSIGSIDWSKITNTPTTLSGYGIADAYTKTEADNKFVPYTGANANVNLGSNNITANSFVKAGGTSAQFLKADGSVDTSQYVPTTRSINAGTGLTGGGNLSSDVNIAFDTTWGDTRYAYRTRQLTINGTTYDLSADRIWNVGTVTSVGLSMPSAFTVSNSPVIGAGVLTVVGAGTILEYVRGDGSLATFPSLTGYVPYTGATQDLNLGTYGLISDFVRFNPSSSNIPSAEGVMWWDNTDGTVRLSVKGNTYSVPIGQSVISRVRNSTGGNLLRTNYQVVKVAGAQGQRLAVSLAQANNDLNSASTLGLVCEDISNNQEGFIVNIGQIVNVNTTGNLQGETWLDGDVLYLSPTIAGAITKVKPLAPQHTVILGYVEYAHANNGKIYVKIDNGYELEELHDVSAEPFINNGLLYRDTTLNLWKSATISTILGYTPAPQGNYITSLTGEATASGPGAASVTLSNSAVTGKVLNGLNIAGNEILSTDSILTAFGKLQHQVNQLVGGLQYEGTWNASTNTPTITSSVGTDGTFYIVSVAGTTNINGITDWQVGDWIVFHDTAWQKVDNSDSVSSVFGRVGNIVANQADYSAFYPLIADIKNGVLTVQGTGVLSGSGTFSANQATNNTISLIHSAISRTDTTSTQTPSFGGSFNVIDSVTSSAEGHITEVNTKTVTIPSTVASASQTGLLSSANWSTFNSKQNAITLTTTGTSGPATLVGATLNIPNYAPDLSGYVTLATDQTVTGLKTIVRSGDVLNFKIGTDTLYGLKLFYSQNELVPSGEATWSFVNTFNRNGVGYETTPISFFRGVLVTGERLLSASINSNLLDYYGNNPSGRYPVYAYNTGVQQFSTGIIVGKTTGVVNAATGAIADLPAGVVANFNGRVIGGNAVNSNEFVTLSQLGSYVPTSRTLTINGVTFDLSANRSWTITAGVSGVTATSPLFSSGGATPNITIQQANGSQGGFLSSTDWTTFNNKANANGSNASGTWGINITGSAGSVDFNNLTNKSGGTGTYQTSGDFRAPVFFDSQNTAFYLDANATSTSLNIAGQINTTKSNGTLFSINGVDNIGYNATSGLGTYIKGTGSTYIYGGGIYFDGSTQRTMWHSGNAPRAANSNLMYYQGFTLDANSMDTNSTGFTYAVNAPYVGPIARFSASNSYDMWINAPYSGGGFGFAFRTVNGDTGTINPWRYPAVYGVNANGGGDLYATIYYDQNNTGYYVDPASTSNLYYIQMPHLGNGSPNIVVNNGGAENWGALQIAGGSGNMRIGVSSAGRSVYGRASLSMHIGAAESFRVHSDGWDTVFEVTGSNGIGWFKGDARAPIFYDSNDTSYYLDPNAAGTSLRISGSIFSDGSFATNGYGTGGNAAVGRVYGPDGAAYSFSGGAVTGAIKIRLPFRANDSMWSMKVRIYNYSQYQTSEYLLGNYSYSQGAWNFSASFLGGSGSSPQNVRFGNDGSYDCVWIGETSTGWSYPVVSVMDFMSGYSNGGVQNNYSNWDISVVGSFGTVGATISPDIRFSNVTAVSVNAPSGYVSNGNPWGTANSAFFPNGITTAGSTNWVYGLTYIGNAPGNGSGVEVRANGSSYFRSSGTSGTWGYAGQFVDRSSAANNFIPWSFENELGNHSWGLVARFHIQTAGQDKPGIQFTSAGSNERWSLGYCSGSDFNFRITQNQGMRTDGSGNNDGWGTERFIINTSGNITAAVDFRAPIFYDSNNTGYYGDFASTSRMNSILLDASSTSGGVTALTFAPISTEYADAGYVNRWYPMTYQRARYGDGYVTHLNTGLYKTTSGWGSGQNGWYAAIGGSDSNPTEEWRLTYGGILRHSYGYVTIDGSARSPLFYDSDNTAYYINAASGSVLNWLTVNDWYYLSGSTGLYWSAYSRSIASPEYVGNSYGTIATTGSGRNGWSGYGIGSRHVLMSTTGDNIGIHDNSRGWLYYWNGGFHQYYFGYLQAEGSMRSPIFYDSANTAYYLDAGGGSYLASSIEIANGYFLSNGVGGAMYMTAVSGSFGGYLRTSGHMVLDQINTGYNVYVLDGNSVGVVKNAGSQSWSAFSDATIKTVHSTMEDNLSKLQSITPIYYSFNNFADDKNRIGLIAQEVQEHFPELVEVEPRTEKLTLDYTGLIPVLLGAIKELKNKVETLEKQL